MIKRITIAGSLAVLLGIGAALATSASFGEAPPPPGSKPLSEILKQFEAGADFSHFDEVEFDNGLYEVKYFAKDGSRRRIYVNPVTGQPR
jgi:hypothetical protein